MTALSLLRSKLNYDEPLSNVAPRVDRASSQRLQLEYDEPLSNVAFISNLRRYVPVISHSPYHRSTFTFDSFLEIFLESKGEQGLMLTFKDPRAVIPVLRLGLADT